MGPAEASLQPDPVAAGRRVARADGRVRPEILEATYAEPRLRVLFPWVSMGELHLSRCTKTPWTWDVPWILPMKDGGYWVVGPSRKESVGQVATIEAAIARVVERLAPGWGPAFNGTREELAAYEASRAEADN